MDTKVIDCFELFPKILVPPPPEIPIQFSHRSTRGARRPQRQRNNPDGIQKLAFRKLTLYIQTAIDQMTASLLPNRLFRKSKKKYKYFAMSYNKTRFLADPKTAICDGS